jgi:hypothetical protein
MLQAFSDFLYVEWLADLVVAWSWFWPILEMLHFIGLALLVGIIGLYDFRLLGVAKSVPLTALNQLIPWALVGFAITAITGFIFVTGNAFKPPIDLFLNLAFQLKMLFLALAGANAAYFYLSPLDKAVKALGPGEDTPRAAKVIAATSLALWISIIYFGRMIPWEEAILYALGR